MRGDVLVEGGDEQFSVWLTEVRGAEIGLAFAIGTIRDDDPAPEGLPLVQFGTTDAVGAANAPALVPVALTIPYHVRGNVDVQYEVVRVDDSTRHRSSEGPSGDALAASW